MPERAALSKVGLGVAPCRVEFGMAWVGAVVSSASLNLIFKSDLGKVRLVLCGPLFHCTWEGEGGCDCSFEWMLIRMDAHLNGCSFKWMLIRMDGPPSGI